VSFLEPVGNIAAEASSAVHDMRPLKERREDMKEIKLTRSASKFLQTWGNFPMLKTRISASITIPKTADSLAGNFLGRSAERPIFLRTTLSQALLWQLLVETTLCAGSGIFAAPQFPTFSTISAHSGHRIGSRLELLYCTFVCKVVWETNQAVSRDSFETRRSVIHSRTSTSAKVGDELKSKSTFV
jgi:hypothetical protein